MKKVSSVVWKFFERIEEKGRCVAVLCKLCEAEYKYFGNTTNLRAHLKTKHPIQWDFSETGTLDESQIEHVEVSSAPSSATKRKKYEKVKPTRHAVNKNVDYSVSIQNNEDPSSGIMPRIAIQMVETDSENDEETINLVRQMHGEQNSGEEWLEEDPYQITHIETYEPKPKRKKMKFRKIKREIPSPTDLPGYYVTPKAKEISYREPRTNKDEYSVFGEYIANKLRKLKTPRTRGNIQQLITTILWQAEYGMYDNADSVKRVLMHSVQEPEYNNTGPEFDTQNVTSEQIVIEQSDQTELDQSQENLGVIN